MIYNIKKIKNLSKRLIKSYGTNNPYLLCKYLNITIIQRDFKKQFGAFAVVNKIPFIFLNINLNDCIKSTIIAHELGHYFLHKHKLKNITILRDFSLFSKYENEMEQEANYFAATLLIDENELNDKINSLSITQLSKYFNVNENLIKIILQK